MKTATLALVSLGMAGLLLCSCDKPDTAAASAVQQDVAITVFRILPKTVTDTEDWFSTLDGDGTTSVSPRISGTLLQHEYEKGSMVKKGDVLFRIDPVTFQANLERAKANLQVAQAAVATAKAEQLKCQKDFERNEKLSPSGAVSKKELEESRHALQAAIATVQQAEAQVALAQTSLKQAELDMERTVIHAPIDGLVGAPNVSTGDTVNPGETLATMLHATPLNVVFHLSSERLLRMFHQYEVSEADFSEVGKFQIILEDGSVYRHLGKIHAIDNMISENGLIKVEGDVDNSELELRPGMTVRVRIPSVERDVLLVPADAVITQMLNTFVLAVDKQGVPHLISVRRDGEYEVSIDEEGGYTSTQKLVAVAGVDKPLAESLKEIGYDSPADAPVVSDPLNGVRAVAVSAANSRRGENEAPTLLRTSPRSFKPVISEQMRMAAESLHPTGNKQAEPSLPAFPVKVAPLTRCDVDITQEWFGTLQGKDEADLRPNISGILEGDVIKAGTLVKKGDELIHIEAIDFELARDKAKAELDGARAAKERAEALLAKARDDAERYHGIQNTNPGAISEKTVTDADLAVAAAEAQVERTAADIAQAEASLHIAEINLGYTTICAPFDGRISFCLGTTGAMVTPSSPKPLAILTSTNPMEVHFNVSGTHALRGLRKIMQRAATDDADKITFDIILEDGVPYPAKGVATGIDNRLNKETGTLQVIGEVPNPDALLRSGMPVTIRAVQERIKGAWLVPARAPLCDGDKSYLLVMQKDNAPCMLPVVLHNMVTIPVKDASGKEVMQPMQVVEPDHAILGTLLMLVNKVDNLGTLLLQVEKVKDWKELALKYDPELTAEAFDKEFAESSMLSHRDFVLRRANAKDEIDLVAHARGFADSMELLLHEVGFKQGEPVNIVVEGTQQAAMTAKANIAAGADVNVLTPVPFEYTPPRATSGSVTTTPAEVNSDTAN